MDRAEIDARVREMYAAFASGDADRYREAFAETIVWHVPGDNPVSGRYEGRDAYFGSMQDLMAPLDDWGFRITDVMTNERDRAALVSFRLAGSRRGFEVDMDGCHMIRLDEEGRIVEGWGFASDQDELDRFFSA